MTQEDDLLERVAMRLAAFDDEPWDELDEHTGETAVRFAYSRDGWRERARIAIAECYRWRPIEEAQRDGRWLELTDVAGGLSVIACWHIGDGQPCWIINAPGFPDLFSDFIPTHFRPLGPRPEESK